MIIDSKLGAKLLQKYRLYPSSWSDEKDWEDFFNDVELDIRADLKKELGRDYKNFKSISSGKDIDSIPIKVSLKEEGKKESFDITIDGKTFKSGIVHTIPSNWYENYVDNEEKLPYLTKGNPLFDSRFYELMLDNYVYDTMLELWKDRKDKGRESDYDRSFYTLNVLDFISDNLIDEEDNKSRPQDDPIVETHLTLPKAKKYLFMTDGEGDYTLSEKALREYIKNNPEDKFKFHLNLGNKYCYVELVKHTIDKENIQDNVLKFDENRIPKTVKDQDTLGELIDFQEYRKNKKRKVSKLTRKVIAKLKRDF